MNSEKVKEIKLTLQGFIEQDIFMDRYITPKDCLTLINELETENDCKDIEICKQEYQIKKFKDRIAELEKENGELLEENEGYHGSYRCAIDKIGELYAERYIKVEQFAEMLKEKLKDNVNADNVDVFVECSKLISETLKEFMDE